MAYLKVGRGTLLYSVHVETDTHGSRISEGVNLDAPAACSPLSEASITWLAHFSPTRLDEEAYRYPCGGIAKITLIDRPVESTWRMSVAVIRIAWQFAPSTIARLTLLKQGK